MDSFSTTQLEYDHKALNKHKLRVLKYLTDILMAKQGLQSKCKHESPSHPLTTRNSRWSNITVSSGIPKGIRKSKFMSYLGAEKWSVKSASQPPGFKKGPRVASMLFKERKQQAAKCSKGTRDSSLGTKPIKHTAKEMRERPTESKGAKSTRLNSTEEEQSPPSS